MRSPRSYLSLEEFGRVRLSRHFQMRNFVYSEISNFYGRPNLPEDPDLAIETGRKLAAELLDPLVETFGPIDIRSGYRSPVLNDFGSTHVKPQKMAATPKNFAAHIWDKRDSKGCMGACASVGIPWFAAQYSIGRDWRDLAWWLFDHLDSTRFISFQKMRPSTSPGARSQSSAFCLMRPPKAFCFSEATHPIQCALSVILTFHLFEGSAISGCPSTARTKLITDFA